MKLQNTSEVDCRKPKGITMDSLCLQNHKDLVLHKSISFLVCSRPSSLTVFLCHCHNVLFLVKSNTWRILSYPLLSSHWCCAIYTMLKNAVSPSIISPPSASKVRYESTSLPVKRNVRSCVPCLDSIVLPLHVLIHGHPNLFSSTTSI